MRVPGHRLLALVFCLALPFSANAAGLGELRVLSALGERFRAEIPVVNATESISQGCFHLATTAPEAISDAPWLDGAHIAFETNPPRLLITSRRQVADPIVQLAIYTGCGTYLTRHFVALLSPPKQDVPSVPVVSRENRTAVATPAATSGARKSEARRRVVNPARTALPGETAKDMARRLYPRSKAAQKQFVGQMVALNPDWLSSAAGDELLPEGGDLNYPPPQPRRKKVARAVVRDTAASPTHTPTPTKSEPVKAAEASDRLVLSSNEPSPQDAAAGLSPEQVGTEISARISGVEQRISTARAQLKSLRDQYPSPPPAVQTLLAELETRLISVELNVARINLANLEAEKPSEPALPDSAVAVAASTSENSQASQASQAESEKTGEQAVEAPVAASPAPEAAPVADAADGFDVYMLLLGVLGFGVGLGAFLYRRAKSAPASAESQQVNPGVMIDDGKDGQRMPKPQMVSPKPQPKQEEASVVESPNPAPRAVGEPEEVERPIEMADIMLAYGQTQSAIDVLKSFIDAHPARSFKTSMRLLELYKQTNMRMEFEEFAAQLSRQQGIAPMRWDDMRTSESGTS